MFWISHYLAVHEEAHVRAERALLVDNAKAQAGITTIEISHERIERRTLGLHLALIRVGQQRTGNPNLHPVTTPASTE